MVLQTWNVVKGCAPEMISRTFTDHNLGGQPGQLATGKLQEAKMGKWLPRFFQNPLIEGILCCMTNQTELNLSEGL